MHSNFFTPPKIWQRASPRRLSETALKGPSRGKLTAGELACWGVAEVSARVPFRLLDMRTRGCFLLGVSTDITGAKAQDEARQFSQAVFDQTDLDGILYLSRPRTRTFPVVFGDTTPAADAQRDPNSPSVAVAGRRQCLFHITQPVFAKPYLVTDEERRRAESAARHGALRRVQQRLLDLRRLDHR